MKLYIWVSFCLSFLLLACQPSGNSLHKHSHGEDAHNHDADAHESHATERLTLFSDKTELFVEFPALLPGHTSKFLVHVTNLETYKPYPEGKLTISLIKGEKGIRQTVNQPARAGIFTPSLQVKEAGTYSLVFDVDSKYGKERFVAKNIRVYSDHAEAERDKGAHSDEDESTQFLKEQAWKIDFAVSEVKRGSFGQIIKTTGSLLPAVNMEKQIVAQSDGIVHFQSQDIVAGKNVEKNDLLFTLSGNELAGSNMSTEFTIAKTRLEKAKAAYNRAKNLREDQIVSEKDFLDAKSELENAEIKFKSINRGFGANGFSVVSPVHGFICDIYVNEGQYVEKGTVLAKVDQGSKLLLRADVYQKHLQHLASIKGANFKLPYRNKIFTTEELNGRLIAYGKDIHEEDYTTPLYFEIDLTPDLYAGSFVEVFLKSERLSNVVHIRKSAILEDQGLKYVFVQKGGESFEKRFVSIGSSNGIEVEITSGLQAGERVVSKGVYFVKLASLAGALPAHSHEH